MNLQEKVQGVIDGNECALEVFGILKEQKKEIESLLKKVEPEAWDEVSNRSEKQFTEKGFSFEVRNGGRTFSYKNVPQWTQKKAELSAIEETHKSAFINKEKGIMCATEDGEEIVLPEVTYRKDSIIVKRLK